MLGATGTSASGVAASGTFLQSNSINISSAQASGSLALNGTLTGDLLILVFRIVAGAGNIGSLTVSDPTNGTWNQASQSATALPNVFGIYYVVNTSPGTITVTITPNVNSFFEMVMAEYAGPIGSPPLDQVPAIAIGTSATATTNPVTTTQARELLVAMVANQTANGLTITNNGGLFTIRNTAAGNVALSDQFVTSTGVYTASFGLSSSVSWSAPFATFRLS